MKREAALEIAKSQLVGKSAEELADWLAIYTSICAKQLGETVVSATFANLRTHGWNIPKRLEETIRDSFGKMFGDPQEGPRSQEESES